MFTRKIFIIQAIVLLVALAGGFSLGLLTGEKRVDARVRSALLDRDRVDQLAAARAYLGGMAEGNWNQIASSATGYIWPKFILDRVHRKLDTIYGIAHAKDALNHVSNLRVGPVLSKPLLESSLRFVLPPLPARRQWPDWDRPPRAVFYDVGPTTYFVFVVWENGGWHAFGTPLELKEKYLKSDDLFEALRSDGVAKG